MNIEYTLNEWVSFLASSLSATASISIYFQVRKKSLSVFFTSPLGLLFYSAGILQWFLFGISQKNLILILTCGASLPFLAISVFKTFRWRITN